MATDRAELRETAARLLAAGVREGEGDAAAVARRRAAATALSAPLASMAALLGGERAGSERPYASPIQRRGLLECAGELVALARSGRRALVLTPSAALVAKALHAVVARGAVESLAFVRIRQCRDLHEALRALAAADSQIAQQGLAFDAVAVGPLAMWFAPFQTAGGPTADGEGLLRALELALKRLHATTGAPILMLDLLEEEQNS